MPAKESIQHVLDRIRPPRVQITYDVEIGDAVEQKELPLVVGILADLAGQREGLPRLKKRKFVEIDRDNFDKVMAAIEPRLKLSVEDKIRGDGNRMPVELKFESFDAFHPRQLVEQIEPLRKLLHSRQRLVDLLAKLDGNDALMEQLRSALKDKARLQALASELNAKSNP
ncbi:type VI secretion system contractile sheath small subunit [Archangium minus]|uniref:Type VI secretion system contractile sheath small subunit n=1 Tax=Archangium minus TaxID=83450 RepID=A0ABY9WQR3_9BACT|nr:type VI secretion system contractile sheath small subunit [Archangium violaceum]WNG46157.1 type VI secretion system contractile sheath small subunit [Archangium minus]